MGRGSASLHFLTMVIIGISPQSPLGSLLIAARASVLHLRRNVHTYRLTQTYRFLLHQGQDVSLHSFPVLTYLSSLANQLYAILSVPCYMRLHICRQI